MTINKFQGKTKEEAIEKAKAEFGPNAVIMNIKEIKPSGFFGFLKSSMYEVTAAIEQKESFSNTINTGNSLPPRSRENINLAADEAIAIPKPVRTAAREEKSAMTEAQKQKIAADIMSNLKENSVPDPVYEKEKQFQERLDNLSELLEQRLSGAVKPQETPIQKMNYSEELKVVRMIYSTLLKNEVHERYINQIMEEVEHYIRPGNSVDLILPNIYQKLVLKFGQPKTIDIKGKKPNVVFFVGPTGVGKTTTIAKIASKYKVEYNRKVAFITADTYRIAATEQLRVYANILDAPMTIVYSVPEINEAVHAYASYDLIFVDTAGFSHKNEQQKNDTKRLLDELGKEFQKEVYLVLSATTKYNDLMEIVDIYRGLADYKLIFTKLDETGSYGNILNIKLYADADLSYVTTGQNVPDDIEVFDTQKVVKQLLGGN